MKPIDLQISPVALKINDITHVLPCSQEKKKEINKMAVEISKQYLKKLSRNEERYVLDVALSSVYLSSNRIGCNFSYTDISKNTGYPLVSWTRIVKDIQSKSI